MAQGIRVLLEILCIFHLTIVAMDLVYSYFFEIFVIGAEYACLAYNSYNLAHFLSVKIVATGSEYGHFEIVAVGSDYACFS